LTSRARHVSISARFTVGRLALATCQGAIVQTTSYEAWRRSQADKARAAWGDQGNGRFRNPLIWADYSHPGLVQRGSDFYMTAASHHFMGIPVLHSRDLINWSLLGRAATHLDWDERYNHPGQAYGQGSAAPSIAYHDGRFWVFCTDPAGGLFVSTAADPAGPWESALLVRRAGGWEDPAAFWDDDGNAYLLHSSSGESPLTLHRMSADGRALLDDGAILDDTRPNGHCPFLFKRHGFYYLFTTGVWRKTHGSGYAVIVYRSRNIYGPYEQRVIFGTSGAGRSLGGGGWAEYPAGQCWFLHDMGLPGHGRLPFLEPAGWQGDWPWISQGNAEIGAGWPTWETAKPNSGVREPLSVPAASDEFDAPEPGPQWLWNHNPDPALWSLSERRGYLRLVAATLDAGNGSEGEGRPVAARPDSLLLARNTLAQLIMGKRCSAATIMDISHMADGQRAGLSLFNREYAWIGVVRENGRSVVRVQTPDYMVEGPELSQQTIWLKAVCDDGSGSLFYSLDGESFLPLGRPLTLQVQWGEAHKLALFTYSSASGRGFVDFDWFRLEHDGPSTHHGGSHVF
jgi:beta-xylosidase